MKNQKAITLISLVVTIIVLLILAGVSISVLVGNNGIIRQAITAKENTEIAGEKEHLALAIDASYEDDGTDTKRINRNLVKSNLDGTLGEDKTTLYDYEEDVFYIKFNESNRYYEIDANGNIKLAQITNGEKKLDIIYVTSDGAEIGRETKVILADEYTKTLENISYNSNTYIPSKTTISGTITENTEIKVKYYFLIPEEMMVFTGLTESGAVTTDESKIVSYMLGNNSTTNGNGLNTSLSVESALFIPETHNGKTVTVVGQCSFKNINKLIILEFSNNITTIVGDAFYKTGITNLIIGDNVETIDAYSFYNCPITELTLGSGVTSIGKAAFGDCSALKKVIYNNETTVISSNTNIFGGCGNWTDIEVNEENTAFQVIENILYSKDGTTIIKAPTAIGGNLTIKSGVSSIYSNAFAYCTGLKIVTIGNDVKSIGGNAFYKAGITNLIIGDKVETIDAYSFYNCPITELTLGSGVTSIGKAAFGDCSALKKVIYNNETTVISSNTNIFGGCGNWTDIEVNEGNTAFQVIDNILYSKDGTKIIKAPTAIVGNLTIKSGVSSIYSNAFAYCTGLKIVTIGNDVKSIGGNAFYKAGITNLIIGDKVETIDAYSFYNCPITELTLGSGVTSIGKQAFIESFLLKTVIIDSSTIAAALTSQTAWGYLINYATTIYTKTTPGSYVTTNFDSVETDKEGYLKYVKQ